MFLDTNLTTKQILSFYNVGKDIIKRSLSSDDANLINIQQLFLDGDGQMIYDERARMVLWDYVPNKKSRDDIVQAMKENLELADHDVIKEFHFSINKPYEKKVIGEGPYSSGYGYTLLPSFIGLSEAQARALASRYGVSVSFTGGNGYVINQSQPANKRIDLMSGGLTLTLGGAQKEEVKQEEEPTVKEGGDDTSETGTVNPSEGGGSDVPTGEGDSPENGTGSTSGDKE